LQGQTPEAQRRREGNTLTVKCPYTAQTENWHRKYWCLLTSDGTCESVAFTYSTKRGQSEDKRTTIEDDTHRKVVSITMTDLKTEDSGTYFCAIYQNTFVRLKTISLNVFKVPTALSLPRVSPSWQPGVGVGRSQPSSNVNTFVILSVVLLVLLLLALITSIALGVRHYKLLGRAGNREAEDSSGRPEGTAQPGSTGRRGSSQEDSKGPAYINLDVQSHSSHEDPLYCNVEPSQAPRNPQHVEYAVIAFNQSPRNGRE
ncbi:TRML4 protein, partial [Pycnonotus jocosus]|nr:TRML4 protein [Pycnonotus jocosus]